MMKPIRHLRATPVLLALALMVAMPGDAGAQKSRALRVTPSGKIRAKTRSAKVKRPPRKQARPEAKQRRWRQYRRVREQNRHVRHLYGGKIRVARAKPRLRRRAEDALQPLPYAIENGEVEGPGSDARIVSFKSPAVENHQGQFRWKGPGDTIRFEMAVEWNGGGDGDQLPFLGAVKTTANHYPVWKDYPMEVVGKSGNTYHLAVELPVWAVGSYEAVGVIAPRQGRFRGKAIHWSGRPGQNYRFRPYAKEHDRSSSALVSVMNLGSDPSKVGTFEDMLGKGTPHDGGRYTLKYLADQGFTAIKLNPIQPRTDSPYSSSEMFAAWTELSKPAQKLKPRMQQLEARRDELRARGASDQEIRRVETQLVAVEKRMVRHSMRSLKRFIDEAHRNGLKVYLDVVRNHTADPIGVNDIVFYDADGNEMDIFDFSKQAVSFSVRRNDVRQLAGFDGEQAAAVPDLVRRVGAQAEEGRKPSLQATTPYVFGRAEHPEGASDPSEIAPAGWGQWPGSSQLNTGSQMEIGTGGEATWRWKNMPRTVQNQITRRYLLKEAALWVLLGFDGFRFDHAQGGSNEAWYGDYNLLQGVANRYRGGTNLYYNAEDWNTVDRTKPAVDTFENGSSRPFLAANGPAGFRAVLDGYAGGDRERSVAGNHDEGFGRDEFNHHRPYALRLALTEVMGGPTMTKMGDHLAQTGQSRYFMESGKKLWTTTNSAEGTLETDEFSARARRAKRDLAALHHREHDWLKRTDGSYDGDILAAARFHDSASGPMAVVFANFNAIEERAGTFEVTPRMARRLRDDRRYMLYSAGEMKFPLRDGRRGRAVWDRPMTGAEIKQRGVFARLAPNELQVLDVREVRETGNGRWRPVPRPSRTRRDLTGGVIDL